MRFQLQPWWVFVVLMAPVLAQAQDLKGTRPLSMGHAYRSVASGNESIYYNPAGLTAVPKYSPEFHYLFNPDSMLHELDLTIVDSLTSPLGMGLGYTFSNREPGDFAVRGHRATAAVAYPLVPGVFHLGLGFKYLNFTHALSGTFVNALTADVGVLVTPGLGLSFALVGYNVIPITTNEAPMSMAAAGAWSLAGFTLALDWTLDFESSWPPGMSYHVGAEYFLFDMIPLRVGYENDQVTNESSINFGTGFAYDLFGIDIGYQQGLERFDDRTLAVSLKFYLFTPPPVTATAGSYSTIPGAGLPAMPQSMSLSQ